MFATLLATGGVWNPANAQTTSQSTTPSYPIRVWRSLELRQNVDIKNQIAKPATFQITLPRDSTKSTYVANLGVLATVVPLSRFSGNLAIEFNRNTTLAKKQDAARGGFTFDWKPGGERFAPIIGGQLLYKHDRVKDTWSKIATALVTSTGYNKTGFPNTTIAVPIRNTTMVYSPSIGVEMERSSSGDTLSQAFARGFARFDLVLRVGEPTEPIVELTTSNSWRNDWRDESVPGDQSTAMHSVSLSYFAVRDKRTLAGVAVTYASGSDPNTGFQKQAFTQVGFVLRIKPAS